jgi:hypothetical protein
LLSVLYASPKNKFYEGVYVNAPPLANTPGQRLKKVAQATPKGLLNLFVLLCANFPTYFFL